MVESASGGRTVAKNLVSAGVGAHYSPPRESRPHVGRWQNEVVAGVGKRPGDRWHEGKGLLNERREGSRLGVAGRELHLESEGFQAFTNRVVVEGGDMTVHQRSLERNGCDK